MLSIPNWSAAYTRAEPAERIGLRIIPSTVASIRQIRISHHASEREMMMAKAGFGGGCHWCTEGVFQALRGVGQVDQGFVRSEAPADTWAEGVIVTFDPSIIPLATLSEVHLRTHSATRARSPRGKYRSAIYIFEDSQRLEVESAIARFAGETGKTVHTLVLPFEGFRASDERYKNYYRTDPSRPFCRRYIDPKLDFIRRNFSAVALPEDDPSAKQAVAGDDVAGAERLCDDA